MLHDRHQNFQIFWDTCIYYLFISIYPLRSPSPSPRQLWTSAAAARRAESRPSARTSATRPSCSTPPWWRGLRWFKTKMSLLIRCLVFCLALFALMHGKAEAEIKTDIPHLVYFASVRCGVLKSWICRVYDWQQIIHIRVWPTKEAESGWELNL